MSDNIDLDLTYLDELPDPQPGLTDADLRGCRWIASDDPTRLRGLFCCAPTVSGRSWCPHHNAIAWARTARKHKVATS